MRAGAEMLALAKSYLFVGGAFNVEAIRILEGLLVAIPRGEPQRELVTLADRLASHNGVARGNARDMSYRTAPAQNLFNRRRHHRWIVQQLGALGGMLDQREQSARDRIAGGLESTDDVLKAVVE